MTTRPTEAEAMKAGRKAYESGYQYDGVLPPAPYHLGVHIPEAWLQGYNSAGVDAFGARMRAEAS